MLLLGFINIVNNGSQCSGFTAARWPRYQNQPLLLHSQIPDQMREAEAVDVGNLGGQNTEGHINIPFLPEHVHPVPA
ncbi:hypothetical protein D3C75_760220 [compost metagenome]